MPLELVPACPHDVSEQDVAVQADGFCPLCLAANVNRLMLLLEECLLAFEAMPTSATSRKLLKKMGMTPGAWAGNGSHILANVMATRLRDHLNRENGVDC